MRRYSIPEGYILPKFRQYIYGKSDPIKMMTNDVFDQLGVPRQYSNRTVKIRIPYLKGVIVGWKTPDGCVKVGWSLRHPLDSEFDFEKDYAAYLAAEKALSSTLGCATIPSSIQKEMTEFLTWCLKYFKDVPIENYHPIFWPLLHQINN